MQGAHCAPYRYNSRLVFPQNRRLAEPVMVF